MNLADGAARTGCRASISRPFLRPSLSGPSYTFILVFLKTSRLLAYTLFLRLFFLYICCRWFLSPSSGRPQQLVEWGGVRAGEKWSQSAQFGLDFGSFASVLPPISARRVMPVVGGPGRLAGRFLRAASLLEGTCCMQRLILSRLSSLPPPGGPQSKPNSRPFMCPPLVFIFLRSFIRRHGHSHKQRPAFLSSLWAPNWGAHKSLLRCGCAECFRLFRRWC